jgi:hypothetical protein
MFGSMHFSDYIAFLHITASIASRILANIPLVGSVKYSVFQKFLYAH